VVSVYAWHKNAMFVFVAYAMTVARTYKKQRQCVYICPAANPITLQTPKVTQLSNKIAGCDVTVRLYSALVKKSYHYHYMGEVNHLI